ncbi:hypothetical protein FHR71_003334 [Methylobacterium sp. RAS18]|nr:hypothetical protein [Methylobacterium sp. RAS18]
MNRQQRRALDAKGLTVFLFFRAGPDGKLFFYPIEIPAAHLDDNIRLNPGTVKVEDMAGNVVWEAPRVH